MIPPGLVVSSTLMASGTFHQINGPSWEPDIQSKKLLTNWPLTGLSDGRLHYDPFRKSRKIFTEFVKSPNTWLINCQEFFIWVYFWRLLSEQIKREGDYECSFGKCVKTLVYIKPKAKYIFRVAATFALHSTKNKNRTFRISFSTSQRR